MNLGKLKDALGVAVFYTLCAVAILAVPAASVWEYKYRQLHKRASDYIVCETNWQNLPEVKGRCDWLKDRVLR